MNKDGLPSDTLMIIELAKELGISPLDLFAYWLKTGEIKNTAISIVFNDDNELKLNFNNNALEEIISQNSEILPVSPPLNKDNVNDVSLLNVASDVPQKTDDCISDSSVCPKTTSFSKGTIHIKSGQESNVKIGAYVYTTGDILPIPSAIPNVNMRGIILDYSETTITLIKCVGSGYAAIEACSKESSGWRFLTKDECLLLVRRREKLNNSFLKIHRKQIDDSVLLLFKDNDDFAVYDIKTKQQNNNLLSDNVVVDRTFYLYLTKTLKRV